jgi:pantetheine-phosphate adenylyltransferase
MSLVILPGSFDPMTLGHLALCRRIAPCYDEVVVAVMINPSKHYWFDMQTRVRIAEATVAELPNVRVIADEGMLIDLFDRLGADAVCKGWRNETDLAYEQTMSEWNLSHNPRFRTELVPASTSHREISSTEVRSRLASKTEFADLMHPRAVAIMENAFFK